MTAVQDMEELAAELAEANGLPFDAAEEALIDIGDHPVFRYDGKVRAEIGHATYWLNWPWER